MEADHSINASGSEAKRVAGRTSFGLSACSVFAWLSGLFAVAGAALVIVYFALGGTAGACLSGWRVPLLIILPCAAAVIFTAELFIHGRDRLYKTGFAVFLGTAYFIFRLIVVYNEADGYFSRGLMLAGLIAYCVLCMIVWELTSNAYRLKTKWAAVLAFLLPIILHICVIEAPLFRGEAGFAACLWHLGSALLLAAMVFASLGLTRITSNDYRPRRGDRPDGRLLRSLDPINGVAIYIMPNRNGAATYYRNTFNCANAEEYIRKKREKGLDSFGMMHLIAAAYVRSVAQKPAINRFIAGQRIYSRGDELELSMVVKKELKADSPETVITVLFDRRDTPEDVYRKFDEQVKTAKDTLLDSGMDNLAWLINAVPGILKKFLVWFLKLLDYFGFLPKDIMHLSPFHGSMFVTALGSLGIPPVFHHLYDFGNIPLFLAFGARHTELEINAKGEPEQHKYMDYTLVSDERICDGYYYASAIKLFQRYLNHPDRLDEPVGEPAEDVY